MKITFIGAGSLGFTRQLFTDIMSNKEFHEIEVTFTDINEKNLNMVKELCMRDLKANGVSLEIQSTTDRRKALENAKYVINCVRVGGLEAFKTDVEIPLKYGVDQCVGDTLCIGGIMYGQRGISSILDFCKDIKEVCTKDVLLLNYSNPNAMLTWACNHFGGVNTIGLCHGVVHGQEQIADLLNLKYEDLDIICAGINHQTWYLSLKHNGIELKDKLLDEFLKHPKYSKEEKVRIDIFKRFGYYSTESNGHLSEYVPWYRKRANEITDWIDMSNWIHGETCGYYRECFERRNWFETDFPNWLKEDAKKYDGSQKSREHGSYIIESLETGKIYRGHFNVINNNTITNLPKDCIVEVPCYVDANGISVPRIGDLPDACAAICSQSIWVQRLAVKAAVFGDVSSLKQSVLLDPLTAAVCNTKEIDQMVDEMLIAQEKWLPQYKNYIEEIKNNWDEREKVQTNDGYKGAARKDIKN